MAKEPTPRPPHILRMGYKDFLADGGPVEFTVEYDPDPPPQLVVNLGGKRYMLEYRVVKVEDL